MEQIIRKGIGEEMIAYIEEVLREGADNVIFGKS